jgi:endonuclease/exonuclease/phosphatase family metal-dependent hydrolase
LHQTNSRKADEMRIMSWNIQWGRGADGRVDLARTAAVAAGADADVLCFQEVARNHPTLPGGGAGDQVARLSQLLPGYAAIYAASSDLPDDGGGRRLFGNLILSRLSVLQVLRHALPWPADQAVPSMPRVAIEAVVEAGWGPLRLTTTHLEYYSAQQRGEQVEALRRLHAEASGHGGALRPDAGVDAPFAAFPRPASAVLCGDFNFPVEAPEYARLQQTILGAPSLIDAWNVRHAGERHQDTVGLHGAEWPDHPFCCDFVFVSDDLAGRVAEVMVLSETAASDHQPVVVDLV